jgi:hypothetical protein
MPGWTLVIAEDESGWIEGITHIGQVGIATLIIGGIIFLLWKFGPGFIAAIKAVGDAITSMAGSIEGMKKTNEGLVDELRADREQNRACLGRIESGVIDLRDRVKTLESR